MKHSVYLRLREYSTRYRPARFMERKEILLLFVFSCIFLKFFHVETCDPKPLIKQHEGKKRCVYLDTNGKRTIGYGFNMQKNNAREEFIKAHPKGKCQGDAGSKLFDTFLKGPVTNCKELCHCCSRSNETSYCSCVPCLDDDYIERLLNSSLETAIADARSVIGESTFNALCCSLQNAIIDMAYNLGRTKFKKFKKFIAAIKKKDWEEAANEAEDSKWCKQVKTRCTKISGIIRAGCP